MSPPPTLIAIFGAAVWPGGQPSPSLMRRIRFAALAAEQAPDAMVLCSGGVGAHPPSEASIMARELTAMGVAADRLILDEESLDTFDSVVVIARQQAAEVIAVSDQYHLPRIRLMLALLGVKTRPGPCPERPGWRHGLRMALRETLATPYDAALVILQRRKILGL